MLQICSQLAILLKISVTFTTEHETDELLSMQKFYKTKYDRQKTTYSN